VSDLGELLQTPLSKGWTDPNWWAFQLASGSPMLAGGIVGGLAGAPAGIPGSMVGGALGAGAVAGAQALGPYYAEALKKDPSNPDAAFDAALKMAAPDAGFSAGGWALFAFAPFASAVKNILLQAGGIQPAIGAAHTATKNVLEGRPVGEGVAEGIPGSVVTTALPMAGHAAVRAMLPHPPEPPSPAADINAFLDDAARVSPVPHGNEAAADFAFGGAHAIDRADRLLPPPNGSTNVTPDSGTARPSGPGEHAAAPVEEPRAPAAPVEPGPSDPGLRADGQDPNGDRPVPPQAAAVEPEVRPVSGELGTKALTPKDEADTRLLLSAGYDLEEIGDMGRRARVAAIKEAQNDGVKPFEGPLPGAAEEASAPAPTTPTPLFDDLAQAPAPVDKPVESSAVSRETPAPDQADKADLPPVPAENPQKAAPADGADAKSPAQPEPPKVDLKVNSAPKPGRPKNLLEYLASEGGLAPNADLAYHGADKHVVPFHGRLVRDGGLDLDEARRRAVEAGYLPDISYDAGSNLAPGSGASTSTTSDLLEAIDESLRGRHVFSTRDEARRAEIEAKRKKPRADPDQELHHARNSVLDYLTENGIPEEHAHPEFLDRAAQLVLQGEHSIEDAYERAVMEAVEGHEAVAKRAKKENIPFDAPKPRTAPPAREDRAGGERAGDRPGDEVAAPGRVDVPAEPQDREGAGEPQRVGDGRAGEQGGSVLPDRARGERAPGRAPASDRNQVGGVGAEGSDRGTGRGNGLGAEPLSGEAARHGRVEPHGRNARRRGKEDPLSKWLKVNRPPIGDDQGWISYRTEATLAYNEAADSRQPRDIVQKLRDEALAAEAYLAEHRPEVMEHLRRPQRSDPVTQEQLDALVAEYLPEGWKASFNPDGTRAFFHAPGPKRRGQGGPIGTGTLNEYGEILDTLKGMQRARESDERPKGPRVIVNHIDVKAEAERYAAEDAAKAAEEKGAEGKPQLVIPGAEKIGQGEQAQRKADAPLKPKADQKDTDGLALFGDGHKQGDLLDAKPATKLGELTERNEAARKLAKFDPKSDDLSGGIRRSLLPDGDGLQEHPRGSPARQGARRHRRQGRRGSPRTRHRQSGSSRRRGQR
jgi:hypothetical protein